MATRANRPGIRTAQVYCAGAPAPALPFVILSEAKDLCRAPMHRLGAEILRHRCALRMTVGKLGVTDGALSARREGEGYGSTVLARGREVPRARPGLARQQPAEEAARDARSAARLAPQAVPGRLRR